MVTSIRYRLIDPPMVPYFDGTNGSNAFHEAETVIAIGYPRLDPPTYLAHACAVCGHKRIAGELADVPEEKLLDRNFNVLDLPSVRDYVAHHLAARMEQEVYRCAHRNPGFTGEINIHLFCPPQDMWEILRDRIPGRVFYDDTLPECMERQKVCTRLYDGGNTSFGRLVQFLASWDGTPIAVSQLREQLAISDSVWKDLMVDLRVQRLFERFGVVRSGRGRNSKLSIKGKACA